MNAKPSGTPAGIIVSTAIVGGRGKVAMQDFHL